MLSEEKITIVIPIYNADRYLRKCLGSVVAQTYANLEIILVNDGSTDESLQISKEYQQRDSRIIVLEQANQGVVVARQKGVERATGKYIGWVDADDWIEPDYIEKLVSLQQKSGADIVACAHFHDIEGQSQIVKNGIECGVYSFEQLIKSMLCTGAFFEYGITPQLYTKLFKTEILKETQAKVRTGIIAGDDAAVVYPSILKAEKILVSDFAGYHYDQHPNSITKNTYTDERQRVDDLIEYISGVFEENNVLQETEWQLHMYRKYLLSLRQIEALDTYGGGKILLPFGGVALNARVIVYGAGVLGQKICSYLGKNNIEIAMWLDQNYKAYQKLGFVVDSPEMIKTADFDYVIIANITQKTVMEIRKYLVSELSVPAEKIKWFTEEFREVDGRK